MLCVFPKGAGPNDPLIGTPTHVDMRHHANFGHSWSDGTNSRSAGIKGTSRTASQDHSKWLEPKRIDRLCSNRSIDRSIDHDVAYGSAYGSAMIGNPLKERKLIIGSLTGSGDFLLVIRSNHRSCSVSEINGDFCRKLQIFPTPCIYRRRYGDSPRDFLTVVVFEKNRMMPLTGGGKCLTVYAFV